MSAISQKTTHGGVGFVSDLRLGNLQVAAITTLFKTHSQSSRDDQPFTRATQKHTLNSLKSLGFLAFLFGKLLISQMRYTAHRTLYDAVGGVGFVSDGRERLSFSFKNITKNSTIGTDNGN